MALYKIRKSNIDNKGLIAAKNIKKGTRIIEYKGKLISKKESEENPKFDNSKRIYIFEINNKIEIEFRSKSFLRNQVRSMVGCLKYLADNKWNIKKFENVFKSKKRKNCAPPAPASGLYLEKVIY